ncbi:MAG: hypothetical protein ACI9SQ_000218 [Rubritalea sp.]|jgi:hypothetical protein
MVKELNVEKVLLDISSESQEETDEKNRLAAGTTISIMIFYPSNVDYPGIYLNGVITPSQAIKALKYAKKYSEL